MNALALHRIARERNPSCNLLTDVAVVNVGGKRSLRWAASLGEPPSESEIAAAAAAVLPAPLAVELWRVRSILTLQGKSAAVDAAIAALPQPQRTVADTAWNFANTIRRDSPTVAALAVSLKLTDADIDDLFRAAVSLSL